MPIGMIYTSNASLNNTSQNNTSQNMILQNNTSQNNYNTRRLRFCMDLYGLMDTKPCSSCGGSG